MSAGYRAVQWNAQKRRYDLVLGAGIALYLAAFVGTSAALHPDATAETLVIRGFGTCAFALLHVVLCIGPLCRLDPRFLPLLYNRRHLGVATFAVALVHGAFALVQFHALGDLDPIASALASHPRLDDIAQLAFEPFGMAALGILFAMAATSHDYWLANLSPRVWKSLHMGVYAAYALLVAHVALGALQSETSPVLAGLVALGVAVVAALHLAAARRERAVDGARGGRERGDGRVRVGHVDDIPEGRARVVPIGGERVAIFRYDGLVSAVSNVCAHQNGPLGEGAVIDGCITCPWHGFQYDPASGRAPAPFDERIATYGVVVEDGVVWVDPRPNPPGTRVEPARIAGARIDGARAHRVDRDDDREVDATSGGLYVGWAARAPEALRAHLRRTSAALLALAAALGATLASQQGAFVPSSFEFGTERALTGWIREAPVPALVVAAPGGHGLPFSLSTYLLVARGKHGAADAVRGLDGRRVRVRGTLAHLDGSTLLELSDGGIADLEAEAGALARSPANAPLPVSADELVLRGEIVDSKCHFGVMNPGTGKVHRACATRCIEGGIPAVFLLRDAAGARVHLLLTGSDGRSLARELAPWIAEPIEVRGRVERADGVLVLRAEPSSFRRLAGRDAERGGAVEAEVGVATAAPGGAG
ncbi:MAG: ferric reductase-like transmembrane domain-containing protein [Myxococcota bacterium]